jgi:hypothetical protein
LGAEPVVKRLSCERRLCQTEETGIPRRLSGVHPTSHSAELTGRVAECGVGVRTMRRLAGHSDLESTLRYLRPASGPELQAKINAVQW